MSHSIKYPLVLLPEIWKWKWKQLSPVWLFVTPGLYIHEILQARILEWVAFPFSRRSSQPRVELRSPTLHVDSLPAEPQGKPKNTRVGTLSLLQGIFPAQESNQGSIWSNYIADGLFPNWVISLKYTMCPNSLVSTTISTYFTFECFLPPIISSQAH